MYKRPVITAVLIVVLLISFTARSTSAEELKKGDVTVTYPAGLEDKARELADFATKNLLPIRDQFRKMRKALSDTDKVSKRIVEWLGCPEEQKEAEKMLVLNLRVLDSVETLFTDIRLYRESDLKTGSGLSEGPAKLSYDQSSDCFHFQMNIWMWESRAEETHNAFLPVVLSDDGTFHCAEPLTKTADNLLALCYSVLAIVPHEVAESMLIDRLKFYHPYARWFNDGVANWVNLRIVEEFAHDRYRTIEEHTMPDKEDKSLRSKINLLTWLQIVFMPGKSFADQTETNDPTNYPYATEAIDRMFRDLPSDSLGKVILKLKGKHCPDTDTICAAINEVTSRDAKAILLEYVPSHVRTGLAQHVDVALYDQSRRLVGEMDYAGIVRLLSKSVEIQPNNMNAHFNLAWAMRKAGEPKDRSEQHLKIVWGLAASKGRYNLNPFEQDEEAMYLLGRMLQHSKLSDKARETFNKVLESCPDHVDTKTALAELDKEQAEDAPLPIVKRCASSE
jgi:tetratricopeptide (TPR) repeat protein